MQKCPFLIKTIIYKTGSKPNIDNYECIYATLSTTLDEITGSLQLFEKVKNPKKLIFRSLFHSILPQIKKKGLGILLDHRGVDDYKTLEELKFRIGDLLEIEVFEEDVFKEFQKVDQRDKARERRKERFRPY
jgi:hypothetical protein